ncbi:WXG100-like domain-containing protein [Nocardia brasiliensis]
MSITLPSELHWLGWVAGSDWPDGDEDKMWAIAADWRGAAHGIRELLPDLASAERATVRAYPWGEGIEAMTTALGELVHGPESLTQLADILEQVAESADALGTEIEYTKILVISSLAMLAFEIAAAWVFPPTAPLVEAAAIGVTRLAVRLLGQRAVSAIARFAAKNGLAALAKFSAKHVVFSTVLGAGQDLAIQGYQVGAGHRKDVDWKRVGTTAYTAAAAGAVGGPAGGLLGKAAGRLPGGRIAGGLKGAAVGAGAGMIGAVAAWGAGGIANGWTWDPRMLTGGGAYGALVGGSKGIRHALPGRGLGATNFRGPERPVFGRDNGTRPGAEGDGSTARADVGDGSTARPGTADRSGPSAASASESGAHRAGSPEIAAGQPDSRAASRPGQSEAGQHIVAGAQAQSGTPETRPVREEQVRTGGEQRVVTEPNQPGEPKAAESSEPADARDTQRAPGEQNPDRGHHRAEAGHGSDGSRATPGEPGSERGTQAGPERLESAGAEHVSQETQRPSGESGTAREAVGAGESGSTRGAEAGHPAPGAERSGVAEVPEAVRAKLRELGVDPAGMSPQQMRGAAEDAFARRVGVFADRTLALEGAGLRPNELMVLRRELQTQINEFMRQRRELQADLDRYRATATPPSAPQPTSGHAPRPQPTSPAHDTRVQAQATPEQPDATSKIPYTPRYFGVPPIPEFTAATPPDDSIWTTPNPRPEPTSHPEPTPPPTPPVPSPTPPVPSPTPPVPSPTPPVPTPTPPVPTPTPPVPSPTPPVPTPTPPAPSPTPPVPTPTPPVPPSTPPAPTPTPPVPSPTPPVPSTPTPSPTPTWPAPIPTSPTLPMPAPEVVPTPEPMSSTARWTTLVPDPEPWLGSSPALMPEPHPEPVPTSTSMPAPAPERSAEHEPTPLMPTPEPPLNAEPTSTPNVEPSPTPVPNPELPRLPWPAPVVPRLEWDGPDSLLPPTPASAPRTASESAQPVGPVPTSEPTREFG